MSKKITDYLHLYLGCEVLLPEHKIDRGTIPGIVGTFLGYADYHRLDCRIGFRAGPEGRCNTYLLKPKLRRLSDMTEDEVLEYAKIDRRQTQSVKIDDGKWWSYLDADNNFYKWMPVDFDMPTPEGMRWLLAKGFDLFNLIDEGLAIDKATFNP